MRIRVPLLSAIIVTGFAVSPALADIKINVDKTTQTLTVSRDGTVLHTWPVSTGRTGHFTPEGHFRAFRMEKDHFSKEFDDAPMPHSIFFTDRGHAIHGSFDTKKLGRPASGGCVRLAPENAKTLFELVQAEGVLKTKVEVQGDERVAIARANRDLTKPERQASRGTGLPPQYAQEDDGRTQAQPRRERQAVQRRSYDQQYGYQDRAYQQPQQRQAQQLYYDGYGWRPYNGGGYRAPQQAYEAQQRPYYPQQQYPYQQRYGYSYGYGYGN